MFCCLCVAIEYRLQQSIMKIGIGTDFKNVILNWCNLGRGGDEGFLCLTSFNDHVGVWGNRKI